MEEIWKDIQGYENLYKVSNLGRVKRLKLSVTQKVKGTSYTRRFNERILNLTNNGNGYLHVKLRKNGVNKTINIHRLVALHFLEDYSIKGTVNHIDGDKTNNHANNLEWATQSENNQHAHDAGLVNQPMGERIGNSKLKEVDVLEIRRLWKTGKYTKTQIGIKFGVLQPCISQIINKKTWRHI